jgi:hypothetical protein
MLLNLNVNVFQIYWMWLPRVPYSLPPLLHGSVVTMFLCSCLSITSIYMADDTDM